MEEWSYDTAVAEKKAVGNVFGAPETTGKKLERELATMGIDSSPETVAKNQEAYDSAVAYAEALAKKTQLSKSEIISEIGGFFPSLPIDKIQTIVDRAVALFDKEEAKATQATTSTVVEVVGGKRSSKKAEIAEEAAPTKTYNEVVTEAAAFLGKVSDKRKALADLRQMHKDMPEAEFSRLVENAEAEYARQQKQPQQTAEGEQAPAGLENKRPEVATPSPAPQAYDPRQQQVAEERSRAQQLYDQLVAMAATVAERVGKMLTGPQIAACTKIAADLLDGHMVQEVSDVTPQQQRAGIVASVTPQLAQKARDTMSLN